MGCSVYRSSRRAVEGDPDDPSRQEPPPVPEILKIALIAIAAVILAKLLFPKVPGLSALAAHL